MGRTSAPPSPAAPGPAARPPSRLRLAGAALADNARDPALRTAQASFLLAWTAEWAFTVGIGIAAFRDAGALGVGLVGLARMVPAAVATPFAAPLADRVRRERALAVIGAVRAVCAAGVAAAVAVEAWPAVYALAVAATVAGTLFRPVHSALLPSLCHSAQQLTGATVTRGLLDSTATFAGPLLATVLLAEGSLPGVFVSAAVASALSAGAVLRVRYEPPPRTGAPAPLRVLADAREGVAAVWRERPLAVVFGLAGVQTAVRGALGVFVVVVSIELLGTGESGAGLLTTATGAGAVVGSLAATLLSDGRRLAVWYGVGIALWGLPLVLVGLVPALVPALCFLAGCGLGNALVDVGLFTLPPRLVPDALLARVFGVLECLGALGVAVGSLAAPLVLALAGVRGALVAVGCVLPVLLVLSWRHLRALDARMLTRDGDVALLAGVAMLRPLPMPTIEDLARHLGTRRLPAGSVLVAEEEPGEEFFVLERGSAVVTVAGAEVRRLGPGAAFGEVALLRGTRRSATVRAAEDVQLRVLHRDQFVVAVRGIARSAAEAEALIAGLVYGPAGPPG